MKKKIANLTDSEELVMKSVWDTRKEPVLSEVVDRVNSAYGKDWRPQTVSTFLAKLVGKSFLSFSVMVKSIHIRFWYQKKIISRSCINTISVFGITIV